MKDYWARKGKEERRSISRKRYLQDPEKYKAQARKWGAEHREQRKKTNHEWYVTHRSVAREHGRKVYWRNHEKYLALKRERAKARYERVKEDVYKKLGGACKRCGVTDMRVLCIDHVRGDGHKDRWLGKISYFKYLEIVANDTTGRYQILCHNCNWLKMKENRNEWGGTPRGVVARKSERKPIYQ